MSTRTALLAALFGASMFAAGPLATVTGGRDLKINGKLVQTTGIPNWPVAVGDEILTGEDAVVLVFPDQARLTLLPGTKVVLQSCDRCVAQLFAGSVQYAKPANSRLEFCALGHPVRPQAGTEGSVVIEAPDQVLVQVAGQDQVAAEGHCACHAGAPWGAAGMSAATKAVIIGAAGGGATAITLATVKPKKSKKP